MKTQYLILNDKTISPDIRTQVETERVVPVRIPGRNQPLVLVVSIVVLVHLAIIAAAITKTTQYRPLDIINPVEQTSIQVNMVETSPEPLPPLNEKAAPQLLTADAGEREVAKNTQPPPIIKPPPQKPKPKPITKPKAVQTKSKPVMEKNQQPQIEVPPTVNNPRSSEKPTLPGEPKGEMLKNSANAQPKNVSTVGCQVPAPEYPRRAKRLQQEGVVLIRLVISASGTLTRSEIARSSGFEELDKAALASVSGIHCNPYMENGQAISVMTIQPVTFKLST